MLHGDHGEDGDIQGLFELAEIPYVGSGVAASANCMDKSITKQLAAVTGVKMARSLVIRRIEMARDKTAVIKKALDVSGGEFPLFVKPSSAGSSVGARKVTEEGQLEAAIDFAFKFDDKVLVEEMIKGREFEVAVMGNDWPEATAVGEILTAGEFYDYDAKYNNPASHTRVVTDLGDDVLNEIREYAIEIYRALDCKGLARVDFFYSNKDEIVFNEVNTLPGFTNISMYPKLWEAMGVSQPELLQKLINLAMEKA